MGLIRALFNPKRIPALLVTFDALGTLYKFRRPVATQYQHIAKECGLRTNIDVEKLDQAFKSSFKYHNDVYPNYGKKTLESPEVWWTKVVNRAFGELVQGGEAALPRGLGSALYKHFSSGAAYEPFPDVKPFLQSMAALKKQFTDPAGPIVLTGIVTNSDPRVELVLQDMGFRVGRSKSLEMGEFKLYNFEKGSRVKDYYNIANEFDVLSSSFDAGAEKPEQGIWSLATKLALPTTISRAEQELDPLTSSLERLKALTVAMESRMSPLVRIHIGDEYAKDYLGARQAGWDALLLAREGDPTGMGKNVKLVESLHEAAMVVNLIAQEFLGETHKYVKPDLR